MSSQDNPKPTPENLAERLTAVEEWMMHCDHLLQTLNGVLVSVQNRLDSLQASVDRLSETTRTLSTRAGQEDSSPEDERPPHY